MFWWIVGGVVSVLVLYIGSVVLQGWLQAKFAPREKEMFYCDKGHGMFRREHCIDFAGVPYCPICFHTRLKQSGGLPG